MRTAKRSKAKAPVLYDTFKMRGYLEYVLRDAVTGEVVRKGKKHNVVTFNGRGNALAKLTTTSNATSQCLSAIAIGSTTTAPATADQALGAWATARTFNVGTTLTTAATTACTFQAAASWASNETWTNSSQIGEFALIFGTTSAAGAYLFNHITTGSFINFATSNTLAVTITITN